MLLEWLCAAAVIALSLRVLGLGELRAAWLLVAMALTGAAVALALTGQRRAALPQPVAAGSGGFVTSSSCRSCHPAEYDSWHRSYHRRMTQPASSDSVAAAVLRDGGRLQVDVSGRSVELFGRGTELWARLPDPQVTSAATAGDYERAFRTAPTREVQVQLLTGSHHHQGFWLRGARQGELRALPAVYLIAEQRLIPRRDAFLNPPGWPEHAVRWNSNCIQCHTVAGAPGHDLASDTFASSAAELGIACEACHGQGEAHVRAMQNPLTRYRAHTGEEAALAIVNPAKLGAARGSEVCGRCHSYFFPKQESEWWSFGFARSYRPGDDLSHSQLLLSPELLRRADAPKLGADAESLFYRDGTIRIGGREHNGLVRSPCFERGQGKRQLACVSCHSMHDSDPSDQLAPEKDGNLACAQCHQRLAENVTQHSHHAADSPGSLCYNCHMPHTSYALLGAIRSHRVDSPAFDDRTSDRPNACNLCHLERSEQWAAARARSWYGDKQAFILGERLEPSLLDAPAGAVHALAGDAAVRAVVAAALGRRESDQPSLALRAQLLDRLAHDEYAAVRFIAQRVRAGLPASVEPPPLAPALVTRLQQLRDDRPVIIAE